VAERKPWKYVLSSENVKLVRGVIDMDHHTDSHFPSDFERFTPYIWELRKKQHVTAQSLEKIEDGKSLGVDSCSKLTVHVFPSLHASRIRDCSQKL
jgi:hypothetical protein